MTSVLGEKTGTSGAAASISKQTGCVSVAVSESSVVSGDLTQRAKPDQFEAAKNFLEQLPRVPKLIVPGNHDVPMYCFLERLLSPHSLYRKYICAELNPVLILDGAIIIGLDSTAPRRAISNGRTYVRQLERSRTLLNDAPDETVRIVVVHHHFVSAPDYRWNQAMQKTQRAVNCFVDMGVLQFLLVIICLLIILPNVKSIYVQQ